jgi:hypothetical protein
MTWLSRLFGKSKTGSSKAAPSADLDVPRHELVAEIAPLAIEPVLEPLSEPEHEPQPTEAFAPEPPPAAPAKPTVPDAPAQPDVSETLSQDEEDETEEAEDPDDIDPTIGRYEPLDETALDDDALKHLRIAAQRLALSGPHKVGPADPAGPGSLLEALMRLEGEGLVVSRVCDDAESGFYILYEPTSA